MQRTDRISSRGLARASVALLLGMGLAIAAVGSLAAEGTIRPSIGGSVTPDSSTAVQEVLRRGHILETEHRWSEALSHYEDALRQFPGTPALQRRFDHARLNYDFSRRYSDRGFREEVLAVSEETALELYGEILAKIQTHAVDAPNWKELVERGRLAVEVALAQPAFLRRHAAGAEPAAVEGYRQQLRRQLGPRIVRSRQEAEAAAAEAAALAREKVGLPPAAVVLEYACAAAGALDNYSAYLTPGQLDEIYGQIEGNFVGLGVELQTDGGTLTIVRVIPTSPAEEAGILAGEQIVAVDGQLTAAMSSDEAANLLQGKEGTPVVLTLRGPEGTSRQLTVERRRVEVPSIEEARIVDADYGIAYLRLMCFQKTTARDLDAVLWQLHREGMKVLVVDVRGNPGGLLVSAVEVADKFVERGVIVSTRGRSLQEDFTYSAHPAGTWRVPLVVLIDEESASAAEIFAGAVRDHGRGTIVGRRSYGKGSVQSILPLSASGAGMRLTTAQFYSPNGRAYSGAGVEPDVLVHRVARPLDHGAEGPALKAANDPELAAAFQAARAHTALRP